MSVEGIWKVELLSQDGWEPLSTAFLWKGRFHAASADHYTIGSYKEGSGTLKLEARITQHGKIRTVFGSKKKHFDIQFEGTTKKADQIVGTSRSSGGKKFEASVRLTRLGRLD